MNDITVAAGHNLGPPDFGTEGIKADVIAESTSAAGVTIDSTLVKDGQVGPLADGKSLILGTDSDVSMNWNGRYLVGGSGMWAGCPSPADPAYHSLVHEYFNDFRATADLDEWTVTADHDDCTQVISEDAVCGECLLTNKAETDNNAQQINLAQETFKLAPGKKLWFEARLKTAAGAKEIDFAAGLIAAQDLTGVADSRPANGIVFHKDDGDTNLDISSSDSGVDLQTLAVATWTTAYHIIGFYFDGGASGQATITPYVDGVAGTPISAVTYVMMGEMAPLFMVRNGDATTTQTMTIDYVKVVQLRQAM